MHYLIAVVVIVLSLWALKRSVFRRLKPSRKFTHSPTVTPNAEAPRTSADGCEWVNPFSREDGTHVNGHWTSEPAYAGECSSLPDPDPLPLPREKARI
jgi:hypothetical protein